MQEHILEALESAALVDIRRDGPVYPSAYRTARVRAQVYAMLQELPEELTVRDLLNEFEHITD